ncbi:MAG TPA: GntR family transcriptional regulator [Dokdonella sp.]
MTQEDVAARMNVSRMPVLQALQLLRKDGFVHDAPGRGVLVAPLDADWTAKLYEVRGALDSLAARLAAARRVRLDPEMLKTGRRMAKSGAVKDMIDADMHFHLAIYRASGNPLIEESARLHWAHLRRVMGAVLSTTRQRTTIWDEHQAIADAIAEGAVQRAGKLADVHAENASGNLVSRLSRVLAVPEKAGA